MSVAITIDDDSSLPPYEQLRNQLAFQVRSGHLVAGEQLPTVRQLAGDLGLAKNTVVRAYRELEEAGLVVGDGRRGTTVTSRPDGTDDRSSLIDEAAERFLAELAVLQPSLDELVSALRRRGAAS
jgi:DNA-binding transcriptional regulator YhcF (GntR family)